MNVLFSAAALIVAGVIFFFSFSVKETVQKNSLLEECEAKKIEFQKLMDEKSYSLAVTKLSACSVRLENEEYKNLVQTAEVKSYEQVINNPKSSASDRIQNIELLEKRNPDLAKKYEKLKISLVTEVAKRDAMSKKQRGVTIGMTPEEVVASSWGKPKSINRTTTASGVREQWVYGGGNYLYFMNGKLDAVQN
jgi:hypothetical protein